MAIAEFHHSHKTFKKNLAYIGFDVGVKVSLFLKGELYKGSLGNAGLIASHLMSISGQMDKQESNDLLKISGINSIFEKKVAI